MTRKRKWVVALALALMLGWAAVEADLTHRGIDLRDTSDLGSHPTEIVHLQTVKSRSVV